MRINHNIQSLNSYRNLSATQTSLGKTLEKLSSGLRINRTADDAAGLAISQKMRSQIRGLDQAERNILDGVSLVQTAEGGLSNIQEMAQRMRELAVQASNNILTAEDRQQIQLEIEQIKKGINDVANNTDFNGLRPLTQETTISKPQDNPLKSMLDIVFLIDFSPSMTEEINAVKNGITGFFENLTNDYDAKVAIVNASNSMNNDYSVLTNDLKTIDSNLNRDGGYTNPYEVIEKSTPAGEIGRNLGYREGSKKVFILFTDAKDETAKSQPHTYSFNESTARGVVEGANISQSIDKDDIPTYVFGFSGNSFSKNDYDDLTNSTGGKIYNTGIRTASEIEDKLKNDLTADISQNLEGIEDSAQQKGTVYLQIGANKGNTFEINLTDARTTALGIDDIDLSARQGAESAISKLDKALETILSERSKYGAYQNALEYLHTNVTNAGVNTTASESRIADADMALEMAEFTKRNILVQSGQAMLTQANQLPQGILQLLK